MEIYKQTNELLRAIIYALEIKPDDKILSICGSGAQPLSMLETLSEGSLLAIDINSAQIDWTKSIIDIFREGNRELIKKLNLAPRDRVQDGKEYFLANKRYQKIVKNLPNLDFRRMDVTKPQRLKKSFTKGYFSNVNVHLPYFYKFFKPGAIVYIVYATSALPNSPEKFLANRKEDWGEDFEDYFYLDLEKTREVCRMEATEPTWNWTPVVLIKK
jgi:hypothetical protein